MGFIEQLCSDTDEGSGGADELEYHFIVDRLAFKIDTFAGIHFIHDQIREPLFDFKGYFLDGLE